MCSLFVYKLGYTVEIKDTTPVQAAARSRGASAALQF